MKIKNNLIFSFLFTFIYIIFYISNRFIRIRLPKDISYHPVWTTHDNIILYIFLLYLFVFIYHSLKYVKIIPRPNSKFKQIRDKILIYLETKQSFNNSVKFYSENVSDGPLNVYKYFYVFVYVKPFIWFCGKYLSKYFQTRPLIIYFLGFVLPKVIIAITFLIEILFFHHLNYFYKSLILYVIPLILKIILFMIEHHTKDYLDMLHEYFDFKMIDDNTLEISNKSSEDPIKLQQQQNMLRYAETDWYPLQLMYSIVTKIYLEKQKYENLESIIRYGIYIISFGIYILIISGFIY